MTATIPPQSPGPVGLLNLCRAHEPETRKIIEELQQKGIECLPEPGDSLQTLLILYDECPGTNELAERIQPHIARGSRILALGMNEEKLPFHKVWEWMGLGIEEVFAVAQTPRIAQILSKRLQRWKVINHVLESDRVQKVAIGGSPKWVQLLRQVIEIACFSQSSILLQGESGTGKELVARLVHDLDRRLDKADIVLLDCSTLSQELAGSEFFGHEKGSFTNAYSMREGAFGMADGGTLFLDEVGELAPTMQAALLRVIQEGAYKRIGSNQWRNTKFRLVCATNRDLRREVEQGRFRQDLYYRIAANVCTLPPLRERREDVLLLAEHFLQEALQWDYAPAFGEHMHSYLLTHPFPGNVRELRQLMQRLSITYTGEGPVTMGCLPHCDRDMLPCPQTRLEQDMRSAVRQAVTNGISLKDIKRMAGEMAMDIAIETANGNLQAAAKRLDTSDRVLQLHKAGRK